MAALALLFAFCCVTLLCEARPLSAAPAPLTVLHQFGTGTVSNDGNRPYAALIQGKDGNFYGTTISGGSAGDGAIFKMTPAGTVTILHSFGNGSVAKDATAPESALIEVGNGVFYGTAQTGGSANGGAVFRINADGSQYAVLHNFADGSVASDGSLPQASLLDLGAGNLLGTTRDGGTAGYGTVFILSAAGIVTIVHSFGDHTVTKDGRNPVAALIQGADGDFYGTTQGGGTANLGTVYKMKTDGSVTVLHSFRDGSVANDGIVPDAPLILATDGNFYGTTYNSGIIGGTVFRITPSGSVTILHSFRDGSVANDGAFPAAALVQGSDEDFYGLTSLGGAKGSGSAFRITSGGSLTILHSFADGSVANDGTFPQAALIQASDGALYSATSFGGAADRGIVFNIMLGVPNVASVTFNPVTVIGGHSSTGKVTLDSAAREGGQVVMLASSNMSQATVPASVTVPYGSRTAIFPVATQGVQATTAVQVSASIGSQTQSGTLTLTFHILRISFSPVSVKGGHSATGTVTLSAKAPSDLTVFVTSSDPAIASAPASFVIPAGQDRGTFKVTTMRVSSQATIMVQAHAPSAGHYDALLGVGP